MGSTVDAWRDYLISTVHLGDIYVRHLCSRVLDRLLQRLHRTLVLGYQVPQLGRATLTGRFFVIGVLLEKVQSRNVFSVRTSTVRERFVDGEVEYLDDGINLLAHLVLLNTKGLDLSA